VIADYIIRPVTKNDLDGLLILMQEHADYERAAFDPANKKNKLETALFNEPVKLSCWVVERDGDLNGFVSFTFDFSTWDAADFMYMDCLYLKPETRGRGIGTVIIKKLHKIAKEMNCINIQWQTPDFNESAIRFYHKNNAASKNKVRFTLNVDDV
jgi:GNAT superfamily N-acetyltransferase